VILSVENIRLAEEGTYRMTVENAISHKITLKKWPGGMSVVWNENSFTPEEYVDQMKVFHPGLMKQTHPYTTMTKISDE
jgi:hypothetical protein